jgi:hypothetical protein
MTEERDMATGAARQFAEGWIEQRTAERLPVSLPAYLEIRGSQHSARLLNVAAGGAMIETGAELAAGTRLRFSCGTIRVDAVAVWLRQSQCGIKFYTPVADWQLAEQVSRSDALARRRDAISLVKK